MGLWRFPAPVAAACAAIEYGQGSDMQSGPPRRRGSTAEAFYLTAVFAHESMDPLLHTQNMEDGLVLYGGGCAVAKGGSRVTAGLGKLGGAKVAGGGWAAAIVLLGGAANVAVGVASCGLAAICS